MAQFAKSRAFGHDKALATVYPPKSQRLSRGAYQPSRYDNMTGKAHSPARSMDPAGMSDTHDRLGFDTPNKWTRYRPAVQRMSTRLGSKSRAAMRYRWSV